MNVWTNLHEIWYLRYIMSPESISTMYYVNSYHQSLWMCAPIVATQRLGWKYVLPRQRILARQKNCWTSRFLCDLWRIKESMLEVLPRTSCWSYSYLRQRLFSVLFISGFLTKMTFGFLVFWICPAFSTNLVIHDSSL